MSFYKSNNWKQQINEAEQQLTMAHGQEKMISQKYQLLADLTKYELAEPAEKTTRISTVRKFQLKNHFITKPNCTERQNQVNLCNKKVIEQQAQFDKFAVTQQQAEQESPAIRAINGGTSYTLDNQI